MSTFSSLRPAERSAPAVSDEVEATPPRAVEEQVTGGFTSPPNSANPTFAVLKATVLQQTFGHPLAFARTLMQIGYEPIGATRGRTIFGKEAFFYPNIFRYRSSEERFFSLELLRPRFSEIYRQSRWIQRHLSRIWLRFSLEDDLLVHDDESRRGKTIHRHVLLFNGKSKILGPVDPVVPDAKIKPTWNICIKKVTNEKKKSVRSRNVSFTDVARSSMSIVRNLAVTSVSRSVERE